MIKTVLDESNSKIPTVLAENPISLFEFRASAPRTKDCGDKSGRGNSVLCNSWLGVDDDFDDLATSSS